MDVSAAQPAYSSSYCHFRSAMPCDSGPIILARLGVNGAACHPSSRIVDLSNIVTRINLIAIDARDIVTDQGR